MDVSNLYCCLAHSWAEKERERQVKRSRLGVWCWGVCCKSHSSCNTCRHCLACPKHRSTLPSSQFVHGLCGGPMIYSPRIAGSLRFHQSTIFSSSNRWWSYTCCCAAGMVQGADQGVRHSSTGHSQQGLRGQYYTWARKQKSLTYKVKSCSMMYSVCLWRISPQKGLTVRGCSWFVCVYTKLCFIVTQTAKALVRKESSCSFITHNVVP